MVIKKIVRIVLFIIVCMIVVYNVGMVATFIGMSSSRNLDVPTPDGHQPPTGGACTSSALSSSTNKIYTIKNPRGTIVATATLVTINNNSDYAIEGFDNQGRSHSLTVLKRSSKYSKSHTYINQDEVIKHAEKYPTSFDPDIWNTDTPLDPIQNMFKEHHDAIIKCVARRRPA